jgi:hypothetical protein
VGDGVAEGSAGTSPRPSAALRVARDGPRLARRRVRGQVAGQHLDGDNAIEPRVAAAIHLAHAAGTDGGENFVGTEADAGSEGGHREENTSPAWMR